MNGNACNSAEIHINTFQSTMVEVLLRTESASVPTAAHLGFADIARPEHEPITEPPVGPGTEPLVGVRVAHHPEAAKLFVHFHTKEGPTVEDFNGKKLSAMCIAYKDQPLLWCQWGGGAGSTHIWIHHWCQPRPNCSCNVQINSLQAHQNCTVQLRLTWKTTHS